MVEITGSTVFILGAGASVHTGAPLLRDFLVSSRYLLQSKKDLIFRESFQKVFDWIDKLRGASYFIDFDLDNLEHVFSFAEMEKQVNPDLDAHISDDLRILILETLQWQCLLEWHNDHWNVDGEYRKFLECLNTAFRHRWDLVVGTGDFIRDNVITFNYDLSLDMAVEASRFQIEYRLERPGGEPNNQKILEVLKLHGSMNWFWNPDENKYETTEAIPTHHGMSDHTDKFPHPVVTNMLTRKDVVPMVIPPTWSKRVDQMAIRRVWEAAVNAIQRAQQIIVIGYSLPTTDTFFQYLLTSGLKENPNLFRVCVVNSDNSEEFQNRYRQIFARSLFQRGRLVFIEKSFAAFIRDSMESVMKIMELPPRVLRNV